MAFARRGFQVVGVDSSPQMLVRAREAAARANLPITFLDGDLTAELPQLGFSPDLIVCSSVLEYVQRPGEVIEKSARVLAPGGVLLVSVPNYLSVPRYLERLRYVLKRAPSYTTQHRSHIPHRQLARLGLSAGLRPIDVTHFSAPRLVASLSRVRFVGTLTLVSFEKSARGRTGQGQ